jgi:hypothetical protein
LIELHLPDDIDDFKRKHKNISRGQSRKLDEDNESEEIKIDNNVYRQSREMEFAS